MIKHWFMINPRKIVLSIVLALSFVACAKQGGDTNNNTNTTNPKDAARVADRNAATTDAGNIAINFSGSDTLAGGVTGNLVLPNAGENGTVIAWYSSDTSIIDANSGDVTRPANGAGDATVTLTALVSKGTEVVMANYTVTVLQAPATGLQAVQEDTTNLAVGLQGGDLATQITQNINLDTLGSAGSQISWVSDSPSVISNNGTVVRPAAGSGNATVTLTATIVIGTDTLTKTFTVTVLEENGTGVGGSLQAVNGISTQQEHMTVTLNWVNPTGSNFTGVKVMRKAVEYPENSTDGILACQGNITTCRITYAEICEARGYYTIFALDSTGGEVATNVSVNPYCWEHKQVLTPSNGTSGNQFGYAVSISGNYAVIGAPNYVTGKGAAYIYERDPATGVWVQVQSFTTGSIQNFQYFGTAVAVSGNTVVVGASSYNTGSLTAAGLVYIYERDANGSWLYKKGFTGQQTGEQLGVSVAISGDIIAAGSMNNSPIAGIQHYNGFNYGYTTPSNSSSSGAVRIFERDALGVWNDRAQIKPTSIDAGDYFGCSVAIDGDTVVIGAQNEDSNQTTINNSSTIPADNLMTNSGAVYVVTRDPVTTLYSFSAYIKPTNLNSGDSFGSSVSISGNTIVVGAPAEDSNQTTITNGGTASADNTATSSGAAYIFSRNSSGIWLQEAYLKAPNAELNDNFGYSVAISGERVVVGAKFEDSLNTLAYNGMPMVASDQATAKDTGAAYVFARDTSNGVLNSFWYHQAYLKEGMPGNLYYFGGAVSISGNSLLVGAEKSFGDVGGIITYHGTANVFDLAARTIYGSVYTPPMTIGFESGFMPTEFLDLGTWQLDANNGNNSLTGATTLVPATGLSCLSFDIKGGTTLGFDYFKNSPQDLAVLLNGGAPTIMAIENAWTPQTINLPAAGDPAITDRVQLCAAKNGNPLNTGDAVSVDNITVQ